MSFEGPAVSIRGISKSYTISHRSESSSQGSAGARKGLFGRFDRGTTETFWALRDVTYDVPQGEIVGVVGRNGAGKSTLLKILSRITEPTTGEVRVEGRLSSLLEVGTGFHPELTGRENMYLNGSILGMRSSEIDAKFDEIVAFAGVERFLDTPVKRYSSGMYVRLAFSVAAHMEPDILVVDEVLSVGDQAFQKKCLGKMHDVAQAGRTVIVVSHNMSTITRLCTSGIMLEEGTLVASGTSDQIASRYLMGQSVSMAAKEWLDPTIAPQSEAARMRAIRVTDESGQPCETFQITNPIRIEMEYDVLEPGHVLVPNFHVLNDEGVTLFCTRDNEPRWLGKPKPCGSYVSGVTIPGNFLAEGGHTVTAVVSTYGPNRNHWVEAEIIGFQVVDSLDSGGVRLDYAGQWPGVVRPNFEWSSEVIGETRAAAITQEPVRT